MSLEKRTSLQFGVLAIGMAASFCPAFAQDFSRPKASESDSMHRGGMRGGVGGIGIGIGIGVIQDVISGQGNNPEKRSSTVSKKPKSTTKKTQTAKDQNQPKQPNNPEKPPPQTTDKPPPTNVTDKPPSGTSPPANPPASDTPPTVANPPGSTPPAPIQPVAPPTNSAKTDEDCPQRGKGCVALLIDFSREAGESDTLKAARIALEGIGCDVDYITPEFHVAKETRLNQPPMSYSKHREAADFNNYEIIKLRTSIESHRKKLEQGRELGIEMISAHGGSWEFGGKGGGTFGVFGDHSMGVDDAYGITDRADTDQPENKEEGRAGLSRGLFHSGNYKAANKHVCAWLVFEHSCYAGLTPRAVDTLNNTGSAAYTYKQVDACGLHAGYEQDVGVGTSKSDTHACSAELDTSTKLFVAELESLKKQKQEKPSKDFKSLISKLDEMFWKSPSFYGDGGYKHCTGPIRSGYNFEATPKPEDAPRGPYTSPPTELLPAAKSEPASK